MIRRLRHACRVLPLVLGLGLIATAAGSEPVAPVAAADPATTAADPAADPWLAEEGPPVAAPARMPTEKVIESWQGAPATPRARAAAVRPVRLEQGLGDLLAPAITLLRDPSDEEPETKAALARELAPGVPAVQMANVRALWNAGDSGAAVHALFDTGYAVATSLEVQLWLMENVSLLLVLVVIGTSLGFMLLAALMVFPHAAHDLGDLLSGRTPGFARTAALAALVLAPLALGEGILGLALALFGVAFAYGTGRQRNALAMAAVLLVIGLHPLARLASVTTALLEKDPVVGSVFAVADGTETRADLERLRAAGIEDLAAAHALAYHARRNGLEEDARERLEAIAEAYPTDPIMLANLGTIEMRAGRTEEAISYYERASALIDSPTLLFDLSQAYASAFRIDEYETTLSRAQALDDEQVAELSSIDDAKAVADLGLPFDRLQHRLVTLALAQTPESTVAETLAPGVLGSRWFITASAFALVALVCLLFANRFDHASSCTRCGHRICTRCQETVWSEEICEDCHHLFHNPTATDPSLRMARLQALSQREVRLDRVWLAGSLLIPGLAGFASRRPDLAMFGLLLFGWAATWMIWPTGVFADPVRMGGAAWLCLAIPGVLAVLAYVGVVWVSLSARKKL